MSESVRALSEAATALTDAWFGERWTDGHEFREAMDALRAANRALIESPTETPGLRDVNRLAKAMCLANGDSPETTEKFWDREVDEATRIAAEYAALGESLSEAACVFGPEHEPWGCTVHLGVRTRLDETRCSVVRDRDLAASIDAIADALNGWDQGEPPRSDTHQHWSKIVNAYRSGALIESPTETPGLRAALRDNIAASVWAAKTGRTIDEFRCECDRDATCWPHEEAGPHGRSRRVGITERCDV
jgi:hypothetical protein